MERKRPAAIEEIVDRKMKAKVKSENRLVSTGITLLNLAMTDNPKGGCLLGRIVNFVGESSTGKTMIAETILACAANDPKLEDYKLILDDAEAAHEIDTEYMFGSAAAERIQAPKYDDDEDPVYSETVEQLFANIQRQINEGEPFIYVLDSLDSLSDESEVKRANEYVEADDKGKEVSGTYGMGKAKLLSQMLRTINANLSTTNSLVIIISQVRENIGAVGAAPKVRRAGGKALEFYCTHTVWMKKIQTLKKKVDNDEIVIGNVVEAEVKKNKVTGKVRKIRFNIYYEIGADDVGASVDFLISRGVIEKKGAWLLAEALGYEKKFYRDDLVRAIENDEKYELLEELVSKEWASREEAVSLGRKPRFS